MRSLEAYVHPLWPLGHSSIKQPGSSKSAGARAPACLCLYFLTLCICWKVCVSAPGPSLTAFLAPLRGQGPLGPLEAGCTAGYPFCGLAKQIGDLSCLISQEAAITVVQWNVIRGLTDCFGFLKVPGARPWPCILGAGDCGGVLYTSDRPSRGEISSWIASLHYTLPSSFSEYPGGFLSSAVLQCMARNEAETSIISRLSETQRSRQRLLSICSKTPPRESRPSSQASRPSSQASVGLQANVSDCCLHWLLSSVSLLKCLYQGMLFMQ